MQEAEQERFSLQQKVECQKATLLAAQQDVEQARAQLATEFEAEKEHLRQVRMQARPVSLRKDVCR